MPNRTKPDSSAPEQRRLNLILVEDHPLMVDGLVTRLQDKAGMTVAAVARNGDQLKALYPRHMPDVVLCDVGLPGNTDGIELTRELLTTYPDAKVLMFSGYADIALAKASVEAGALGYIRKSASVAVLVECLEAAADGERDIFDRATATDMLYASESQRLRPARRDDPMALLSPRQKEILTLMATTGTTDTATIARQLHISAPTVRTHITRLFHTLGVSNRGAAVALAYQLGLVPGGQKAPAVPDAVQRRRRDETHR